MAITSQKESSRLQLVFENGQDVEGNALFRTKSFNNVKTAATPEQLYQVAIALEPLQQHMLYAVERDDNRIILDL